MTQTTLEEADDEFGSSSRYWLALLRPAWNGDDRELLNEIVARMVRWENRDVRRN